MKFIEQIQFLRNELRGESLTLREAKDILKENSHNLLLLLLCLPFLQPIPLLGLSSILGFVMVFVELAYVRGKPAWVPRRWENYAFPKKITAKVLDVGEKLANWVSKWDPPQLRFLTTTKWVSWWNAAIVIICSLLLTLPLPIPFTNNFPSAVIFIHTLGRLENNGFLVFTSYMLFILCLAFFTAIALGFVAGIGLLF